MNLAQFGNLIEAITWLGIAVAWLIRSRKVAPNARLLQVLAASFALFGVSDLIEIQTGAWWRPAWLFVLKAGCVFVFAGCLWRYLRSKNRPLNDTGPPSS